MCASHHKKNESQLKTTNFIFVYKTILIYLIPSFERNVEKSGREEKEIASNKELLEILLI